MQKRRDYILPRDGDGYALKETMPSWSISSLLSARGGKWATLGNVRLDTAKEIRKQNFLPAQKSLLLQLQFEEKNTNEKAL